MTVVNWAVAASELLRTDVQGVVNRLVKAPGSLALGAFLPFSVALVLLFPFALLVNSAFGEARPLIAAYAMPIAILWAFGPPRWAPAAAVLIPSLPVSQRAVYVHSIARIVLAFSVGFLYAMLPLFLLLFPFQPDAAVELLLGMWPPAALIAVSLAMGTALWGLIGRASPVVHWFVRALLVAWFASVAFVGASGATIDFQLSLLGPLRPFAEIAAPPDLFFFPNPWDVPQDMRAQSAALLLAMCLPAMILPIERFAPRATAEATFLRRGADGGGEVRQRFARPDFGVRRSFRPFPTPPGRTEALSYLSRQWLKVFLWVLIIYAVFVVVTNIAALMPRDIDPNIGPGRPAGQLNGPLIAAVLYTVALAALALVRSPEAFEWAAGLRGRKAKAFEIPVPAFLRIGPAALSLKRWPQLQTFPYSRRDLHSAFLMPLGLFLFVTLLLTVFLIGAATGYQEDWYEPGLFAAGCGLIIVGGFFVGVRSSKRFARRFDPELEAVHTISAGLWAAAVIPLLLVGTVWFASRGFGAGGPEGREVAFAVFLAAATVMPIHAYGAAVNRTVAVERPYESPAVALWLLCGAFVFFIVPVVLLFLWWLPDG